MARLALIGPPGSGKSAVGYAVAEQLGTDLVDVAAELGGPDAVVTLGEAVAARRALELAAIADPGSVVAMPSWITFGPENTTVVYLCASAADTYARSGMNRPGPVGLVNPRSMWAMMLRERDPQYRESADIVIEIGRESVTDIAAIVLSHLR